MRDAARNREMGRPDPSPGARTTLQQVRRQKSHHRNATPSPSRCSLSLAFARKLVVIRQPPQSSRPRAATAAGNGRGRLRRPAGSVGSTHLSASAGGRDRPRPAEAPGQPGPRSGRTAQRDGSELHGDPLGRVGSVPAHAKPRALLRRLEGRRLAGLTGVSLLPRSLEGSASARLQ